MSAFRGPQHAFRLLTSTWRNPSLFTGSTRYEFGGSSLRANMSSLTLPKCSSVKPKENQEDSQPVSNKGSADPFGLEEVMDSDKNSASLVQGFYPKSEEKSQSQECQSPEESSRSRFQSGTSIPPSSHTAPEADPEKRNRLSLYDNWLRQRMETDKSEESEIGVSQSYREASFGKIRMDSDNPVKSHGHYDQKGYKLRSGDSGNFRQERRRLKESQQHRDQEPIIETIEADHSKRMRASDFLKQMQGKYSKSSGSENAEESQESDSYSKDSRKKIVIEKIIQPRNIPSMDVNDRANYESAKMDPLVLDVNIIPKEYQLPEYNKITEQDMWNILRKTIVFQNDFIMAINKPSGVPVHSKARDCRHTIIQFLKKFADLCKCEEVYPLHRLDKETTGVMLFAKDKKVASVLKEKFAKRQIAKVYLAATKLCPSVLEGTIKIPIGEGKIPGTDKFRRVLRPDLREYGIKATTRTCVEAITNYKVVHSIKEAAFLEIEPVTGYKHQVRVHLGMGLGCPIIGDHKYSHRDKLAPQRLHPFVLHRIKVKQSKVRELPLHLHCNKVSFTLPKEFTSSNEPVYIHANIPLHMRYTLKRLGLIG